MGNPVPGSKIHRSCLGKAEDALEFPHCSRSAGAVDAVRRYPRNCRINSGYGVQLFLKLTHLGAGASLA